jgi:hypothetical protein
LDVTNRARLPNCPDCAALLCSAMCFREHRYHAHPKPRRPPPRRRLKPVECDRCGTSELPFARTVITEAGWVTFALLLVLFFPLCWMGLLITETRWFCSDCGARV